jgi:predicted  nucleic acid-binding Zn-ribbon protein
MGMEASHRSLSVLASVRCLECGAVYAKPTAGGTSDMNPGCPVCGYVGWIPVRLPAAPGKRPQSRTAPGRLLP